METLTVDLAGRAYPIHIGRGLLDRPALFMPDKHSGKAVIVSNTTVAPRYLAGVETALKKAGVTVSSILLPDGEQHKNWESLNRIFDGLLAQHCERSTTLIALGGGVVGDITGFAAACYQRGMPFVQIPTTLLAQVDSSVGGKTAINHPRGKNMIGAFYQPRKVLIDTDVLATLPDRELKAGLAEVIKYGLIRDLFFLAWLEQHIEALLAKDPTALAHAISQSCRNKAAVVAADEHEAGERALLNLGHTFGHAIETGMGYGTWLHGEAVAVGILMAAEVSCRLGWLSTDDVGRIDALFSRAGLPCQGPALSEARYLELMQHDKKVQEGRRRLVLLQPVGHGVISDSVPDTLLREAIRARTAHG